jgi:hypothetical protein
MSVWPADDTHTVPLEALQLSLLASSKTSLHVVTWQQFGTVLSHLAV